jgi:heme exporter protein B
MRAALVILQKDLRIEWRTKESLASYGVLGVLLLVVFAFAHDPTPAEAPRLAPAVLWVTIVFTGMLGIQRAFAVEREQDCMAGLLGAPIDPSSVYVAKLAATLFLLAAMQVVLVPLAIVLLRLDLGGALPALVLVLVLGDLGFASLGTLFAAVAMRTRAREVLLPVLLLPLVVPVVIAGVKATQAALAGGLGDGVEALRVLAVFDLVFAVAGWLLFQYVVQD